MGTSPTMVLRVHIGHTMSRCWIPMESHRSRCSGTGDGDATRQRRGAHEIEKHIIGVGTSDISRPTMVELELYPGYATICSRHHKMTDLHLEVVQSVYIMDMYEDPVR